MHNNQSVEESLQHQTVKELFTEVESSIAAEASVKQQLYTSKSATRAI